MVSLPTRLREDRSYSVGTRFRVGDQGHIQWAEHQEMSHQLFENGSNVDLRRTRRGSNKTEPCSFVIEIVLPNDVRIFSITKRNVML